MTAFIAAAVHALNMARASGTCRHCGHPIVRCDTVPSHAGCGSGFGWIHSDPDQWGHSCRPRSGAPYAQPGEPQS
jgi:hypothetical protein